MYGLRNDGDLESIVEEMSAIYAKRNTLLQMYHEAVSEPYSFLYTNLTMKDNECLCKVHKKYVIPGESYFSNRYIMTTFTNSESRVLTYTNELLETILIIEFK